MTGIQRLIKHIATAFAIMLIFGIFSGITSIVVPILHISEKAEEVISDKNLKTTIIDEKVNSVNFELSSIKLNIYEGDKFSYNTNCKNITVQTKNNTIEFEEPTDIFYNDGYLNIYIPESKKLSSFEADIGAGSCVIEKLKTKKLFLNSAAGKLTVKNTKVSEITKIDFGIGEVEFTNCIFKNFDLSIGIGHTVYNGKIKGESKIDGGIGELNLNLCGAEKDYCIAVNKGIGEFKISGNKMSDSDVFGKGENKIEINSGIGETTIDFIK